MGEEIVIYIPKVTVGNIIDYGDVFFRLYMEPWNTLPKPLQRYDRINRATALNVLFETAERYLREIQETLLIDPKIIARRYLELLRLIRIAQALEDTEAEIVKDGSKEEETLSEDELMIELGEIIERIQT